MMMWLEVTNWTMVVGGSGDVAGEVDFMIGGDVDRGIVDTAGIVVVIGWDVEFIFGVEIVCCTVDAAEKLVANVTMLFLVELVWLSMFSLVYWWC